MSEEPKEKNTKPAHRKKKGKKVKLPQRESSFVCFFKKSLGCFSFQVLLLLGFFPLSSKEDARMRMLLSVMGANGCVPCWQQNVVMPLLFRDSDV